MRQGVRQVAAASRRKWVNRRTGWSSPPCDLLGRPAHARRDPVPLPNRPLMRVKSTGWVIVSLTHRIRHVGVPQRNADTTTQGVVGNLAVGAFYHAPNCAFLGENLQLGSARSKKGACASLWECQNPSVSGAIATDPSLRGVTEMGIAPRENMRRLLAGGSPDWVPFSLDVGGGSRDSRSP